MTAKEKELIKAYKKYIHFLGNEYDAVFTGTDSSNNKAEHSFILRVQNPPKKSNISNDSSDKKKIIEFSEIVKKYKKQ